MSQIHHKTSFGLVNMKAFLPPLMYFMFYGQPESPFPKLDVTQRQITFKQSR